MVRLTVGSIRLASRLVSHALLGDKIVMISVVAGKYRGKKLRWISDPQVRPMPNKLKESLFSIIQADLPGALFLDGFAGTGSVGIEALSRGARAVFFVESFYQAVKTIHSNLARCGAEDDGQVMHREFNRAVIDLAEEGAKFDIIFLDPPYRLLEGRNPLKVIFKRKILKEDGVIILRRHFKTLFDPRFYQPKRRVRIGDDVLVFYETATFSSSASR